MHTLHILIVHFFLASPKCSLYKKIDTDRVLCWNEATEDSGKTVFKAWEDRLGREKMVESDVDQELLFHVPLVAQVNDVCIHIHVLSKCIPEVYNNVGILLPVL